MIRANIPEAVVRRVGTALTADVLDEFWRSPHTELDGESPEQLWQSGRDGQERVRVLILIVVARTGETV